jgi:signal transduction histidine kinase
MSVVARVLGPLGARASYLRLAFLASALPLAWLWLGSLVFAWTVTLTLALTPFVVPALIGFAIAVRAGAAVEAALARTLLGAEVQLPPRRAARGYWARAWAVLRDPFFWKAQAYLVARLTLGFALAVAVLVMIAAGVFLLAAPTFYWSLSGGIGPDSYRVHTLPEALSLIPVGALVLIGVFHLLAPLAAGWRTLSCALLGQGSSAPTHARTAVAAPGLVRALVAHAATSAGASFLLTAIWALTSRGYFWPVWPMLALALPLAIHAWVLWARAQPGLWLRLRLDTAFAIHAGVWGALLLFLAGIWAASEGGYFWPVWPLLVGVFALGAHAAALLLRRPDARALSERISALESSRAGAVDVQEAELRRIERDLHDGAQARLVALGMSLGMAEQKLTSDDTEAARELLAEARAGAGEALRELRGLARGIHPPVLADRGLEAAVRALAAASPIPVGVSVQLPERPKAPVESAAYFVVAEALANAGKHARATRVDVRIASSGEHLDVSIEDDGTGGADPSGNGLGGLRRRVEALDGTLSVISPRGGPTTIGARLPCA